jgi:toxin ParE1/3/4
VKTYALSDSAANDIENIFTSSISNWGTERAELYLAKMHESFKNLAAFPDIGKDISQFRKDYRQCVYGSHNVFYRTTNHGVLIIRILHQKQLSHIHL